MNIQRENGFTLYELMITITVIGVVLAVGIPNFSQFTANSRMTATVNDIHASFQLARSEAARSKDNVTICASATSMDANPDCGGTLADGWIVFVDVDGDIAVDADDAILRAHPAIDTTITIDTGGAGDYFSFAPSGLGRGDVGAGVALTTAILCDKRGNIVAAGGTSSARALVVTPIGRANVLRYVDQITAQGGCP